MDNELTIDQKINSYLEKYGITDTLIIPENEKEKLLSILSETKVIRVFIENNELIIES
jgi:hypothetical protein